MGSVSFERIFFEQLECPTSNSNRRSIILSNLMCSQMISNRIIKSKQLVTEEKMIAHLNSIHISSDYTTHDSTEDTSCEKIDDSPDDNDQACSVQDIEQKLRQANRITVSDVVRTIRNDPLLPAAILERYERPSKALVLWQPPPQRITDLFTARVTQEANQSEDESNNNTDSNVEFEDATSAAEMDLDT